MAGGRVAPMVITPRRPAWSPMNASSAVAAASRSASRAVGGAGASAGVRMAGSALGHERLLERRVHVDRAGRGPERRLDRAPARIAPGRDVVRRSRDRRLHVGARVPAEQVVLVDRLVRARAAQVRRPVGGDEQERASATATPRRPPARAPRPRSRSSSPRPPGRPSPSPRRARRTRRRARRGGRGPSMRSSRATRARAASTATPARRSRAARRPRRTRPRAPRRRRGSESPWPTVTSRDERSGPHGVLQRQADRHRQPADGVDERGPREDRDQVSARRGPDGLHRPDRAGPRRRARAAPTVVRPASSSRSPTSTPSDDRRERADDARTVEAAGPGIAEPDGERPLAGRLVGRDVAQVVRHEDRDREQAEHRPRPPRVGRHGARSSRTWCRTSPTRPKKRKTISSPSPSPAYGRGPPLYRSAATSARAPDERGSAPASSRAPARAPPARRRRARRAPPRGPAAGGRRRSPRAVAGRAARPCRRRGSRRSSRSRSSRRPGARPPRASAATNRHQMTSPAAAVPTTTATTPTPSVRGRAPAPPDRRSRALREPREVGVALLAGRRRGPPAPPRSCSRGASRRRRAAARRRARPRPAL